MSAIDTPPLKIRVRTALWRTNDGRCFFCGELVTFRELEIDHLIPRVVNDTKLSELVASLELPVDFHLNHILNLVPTHGGCNRRKGAAEFTEANLRFFFEMWRSKQARLSKELERVNRAAANEDALVTLALRIENGELSLREAVATLELLCSERGETNEPWVVTFGLLFADLPASFTEPYSGPRGHASLCDRLESELAGRLGELRAIGRQTEASGRTGETLSVRYAFWNLDLNSLDKLCLDPFEVLEVAPYGEVYNNSWNSFFPRAVVDTYKRVIRDDKDHIFGLGLCPQCGSGRLNRSSGEDPNRGKLYYFIECEDCHWSDWSQ
jgi:5-methylcytosine-specific restriction endonuclease McrA